MVLGRVEFQKTQPIIEIRLRWQKVSYVFFFAVFEALQTTLASIHFRLHFNDQCDVYSSEHQVLSSHDFPYDSFTEPL
jgi:hypothetical protein